jgi:hypothetical protein
VRSEKNLLWVSGDDICNSRVRVLAPASAIFLVDPVEHNILLPSVL